MNPRVTEGSSVGQTYPSTPTTAEPPATSPTSGTSRTIPPGLSKLQRTPHKLGGSPVFQCPVQPNRVGGGVGVVIPENSFGRIPPGEAANLCYPNISSCVTVSALTRNGSLRGVHLTTPQGFEKKDMETTLEAIDARNCEKVVVAGPINEAKARTKNSAFDTRANITARMHELAPNAEVGFVETEATVRPHDIYVRHDPQTADGKLEVHVAPSNAPQEEGVKAGKPPQDASIPGNANRVADGDIVQSKPGGLRRLFSFSKNNA
ncbi:MULTISPECIES: hypothetical protein [unclassified Burkholderia]|uniref:hypothetical protein n=1 Tax=unclassified Burkholderia TaxID=2613784 RepID=UPI000751E391|nr:MULTISPECIES: hypothetical protein [unclassified Burkholderia]KVN16850.1 hypothetical protein WT08_05280 [Burkholderia sp. MSMB1552]KWZ51249.1 hypothetical protein WS92_28590 [Burkholderia sp. MSMB1588]